MTLTKREPRVSARGPVTDSGMNKSLCAPAGNWTEAGSTPMTV